MDQRYFDLDEAEALLPEMDLLLREAIEARKQAEEAARAQAREIERVVRMGGMRVNVEQFAAMKKEKQQRIEALRETLQRIEQTGCLVKDLEMGLLDFPCRTGGEVIYLCWRLGETRIEHWHRTDEGFASRKPLDASIHRRARKPYAP